MLGTTGTDWAGQAEDPSRRLVIAGNKDWQAAADVRHRWLSTGLFARRALSREAQQFLALQLLAMPEPLRSGLAAACRRPLLATITGRDSEHWASERDTAPAGRLTVIALASIITAYEHAMTEGEGRNTWRTDRYSPCPRADAGRYLAFLSDVGYQLSAIEQAVVDGVPWTGEVPLVTVLTGGDESDDRAEEPGDGADDAAPADGAADQVPASRLGEEDQPGSGQAAA
jgi:ParB family chromosome partitioning protein